MKIGIFGGSFNPPHNMHKDISINLIKKEYLDKVIYVPTGDNYIKKDLISFNDRYNMVNLMIKNHKSLSVSNIGNSENYQYTYQVLDYFNNIYPQDNLYFICGTDNLLDFNTWKEYNYILEKYNLLAIGRNNDDIETILSQYKKYKDKIIIADINKSELSSTYLRNNIDNINILEYIDKLVYEYIKNNNLYSLNNKNHTLRLKKVE